MRNVRLVLPPEIVASAAYLKEATGTTLPYVYVALLELALASAPLTELVAATGGLIDRRAQAAALAAKPKTKGGKA